MQRHENFNGFEFDANRVTPHFSDARVIQAARAVVPLVDTENRSKKKSRFFLTGAFAAAMLLGAAVALIAARFERQRFQEAVVNVSKVETTNQPGTPEQQTQPAEKQNEEVAQPEEPEFTEPDESTARSSSDPVEVEAKPVRAITKKSAEPVSQPHHDDQAVANDPPTNDSAEPIDNASDEDTEKNTQPVLVDQWQERRLRRIEKLDRRARRAAQRRDLMRIDEIFEGSHRPQQ